MHTPTLPSHDIFVCGGVFFSAGIMLQSYTRPIIDVRTYYFIFFTKNTLNPSNSCFLIYLFWHS